MGFMVIVAVFVSLLHILGYILQRRIWGGRYLRLSRCALVLNMASIFGMGVCWGKNNVGEAAQTVLLAIAMWLMLQVFAIALLAVSLGVRFVYTRCSRLPVDESRRRFAKGALLLPCVAVGASAYGSLVERNQTVVRSYDVPIRDLGEKLRGFSLAQLSDVHLGNFFDLDMLDELLMRTAQLKPDVLVITGDLFDDNALTIKAARLLDSYVDSFPYGIYYCRGNHEHYRGIALLETALAETRVHNLVNTHELVVDDSRPLYLAGVDYPMQREQFELLQEAYTSMAMEDIPPDAVRILLSHHPDFVTTAAKYDADLVLSGHTHGGQLGFMGIPLAPPLFRYMRGWYHEGETALYVHSGNGSWFPFRFGCPPEIAIFRLQNSDL